jgi:WD40 repeat protein
MNVSTPGSDSPTQFDVFLSHSSKDKPEVEWLAGQIEKHGLRPFLDKWDLHAGRSWRGDLERALENSKTAVVFFGPHGVGPWHDAEIDILVDQATTRRNDFRLTSILLPGATLDNVPKFLRRLGRLDFSQQWEDPSHVRELVSFVTGSPFRDGLEALPEEPAPYRGLERFEASHAEFFFGRDREVRDLAQRLRRRRFVAVIGASGCGKSSLVRAGLQKTAAREEQAEINMWPVILVVPGTDPFRALADAIRLRVDAVNLPRDPTDLVEWADKQAARMRFRPDGLRTLMLTLFGNALQPTVLLIDQFEELFTYSRETRDGTNPRQTQTEAFIAALVDCVRSGGDALRVLITLRADFVDRCSPYPGLKNLFEDNVLWLFEPDDNSLREVIKLPAAQRGAFLETGLVELILQDFRSQTGSLPLLEHMLLTLWKKRHGRWLTLEAYQSAEGLCGALDRHADEILKLLPSEAHRRVARQWFVYRLITPGDGVPDTRRRVPRSDLYPEDPAGRVLADEVLNHLSGKEARLLVLHRDSQQVPVPDNQDDQHTQVEITHEALLRGWKQLGTWLTLARDRLRQHRRLSDSAADWIAEGRPTDTAAYLLTGGRLEDAEELAGSGDIPFNKDERDFLEASRAFRQRQADEAVAEAEKERVRQQREVMVAREHAEAQAARAAAEAERAREAEKNQDLAESAKRQAEQHARAEQAAARRQRRITRRALATACLAAVAFVVAIYMKLDADDAHQKKIDTANKLADEQKKRADDEVSNRKRIQALRMNEIAAALACQALLQPSGTGDERRLLLAQQAFLFYRRTESPALDLVDSALRDSLARQLGSLVLRAHENSVTNGVVAGDRLVTSDIEGTLLVWDLSHPQDKRTVLNPTEKKYGGSFGALRLTQGGRVLVAAERSGFGVQRWDLTTGRGTRIALAHELPEDPVIALSPDGTKLALGGNDGHIILYESLDQSEKKVDLKAATGGISALAFSPDGSLIAAGTDQGAIYRWEADATAKTLDTWASPEAAEPEVTALAFSRDGKRLASGTRSGAVWAWDEQAKNGSPVKLGAHGREVAHVEFSGAGDRLASSCWDGVINVWPLLGGTGTRATFQGHDGKVCFALFARDDQLLVSGGFDHTVRHWILAGGPGAAVELPAHAGSVESIAFNPSGSIAATDDIVSVRNHCPEVRLWNMTSISRAMDVLKGHEKGVSAVRYSPDGKLIVTGGVDGRIIIRSADPSYAERTSFSVPSRVRSIAVSPNGSILALGCSVPEKLELKATTWLNEITSKVVLLYSTAPKVQVIAELELYGHCQAVAISSDNRWLAVGRQGFLDQSLPVLLFRLDDPKARPTELASDLKGPIRGLAFSRDGKWLAAGTAWLDESSTKITDGRVLLWDMAGFDGRTSPRRLELSGGEGAIAALHFSPTEPVLAAGASSGAVLLWDLKRLAARPALLRHHQYPVRSVAVHPDGKSLLSGDARGRLVLWRTTTGLFAEAGRRVSRNLSWSEWREFVGTDLPYEKTCAHLPVHPTVIPVLRDEAKSHGAALAAIDPSLYDEVKPRVAEALRIEINEELERWLRDPNPRRTVADHERECTPAYYLPRLVLARVLAPGHPNDPDGEAKRLCSQSLLHRGRSLVTATSLGHEDVQGALRLIRRSRELDPTLSDLPAEKELAGLLLDHVREQCRFTSWGHEDVQGALRLIRRSRELDPTLSDLPAEKELAGLLLDYVRRREGERLSPKLPFSKVTKLLEEAARLDTTIDVAAQLRAAKGLRAHAHADDAVFELNRMTVSSTESGISHLNQGTLLLEKAPATPSTENDWPAFLYLANRLAEDEKLAEATNAFAKAKGQNQVIKYDATKMGRLAVAVHRLWRAQSEAEKGDVGIAVKWFQSIESQFPEITLHQAHWNHLCWYGSLRGRAKDVLFAGEKAVELEEKGNRGPYKGYRLDLADYRDTRGVARALTGDFKGAISDLEYFVANHGAIKTIDTGETAEAAVANARKLRQKWIEQLKNDVQPFTDDVRTQLLAR